MTDDKVETDRRKLLGMAVAATAGGIAAGGVAAPGTVAAPVSRPASGSATTGAAADAYQETDHIRAAYRRMRF